MTTQLRKSQFKEKPNSLSQIDETCWTIYTPFRMKGISLGNRMTIFKVKDFLVLINGVELSPIILKIIKKLEIDSKCKVKYLFSPGDWHHLFLKSWVECKKVPNLRVIVPKGRIQKVNHELKCELFEQGSDTYNDFSSELAIISFQGLSQPFSSKDRNELYFYHKTSRTLVTGDTIVKYYADTPPLLDRLFLSAHVDEFAWNPTGKNMIKNIKKAKKSVEEILDLDIKVVIPPHGEPGGVCLEWAKEKLRMKFESVLK